MPKTEKINITKNLKELEDLTAWFKEQREIDIEIALDRVKKALPVLKSLKSRLREIENEFLEIRKDLEDEPEKK